MTQPLSHTFMESLLGVRDQLYAMALARAGSLAGAEAALQLAARQVFAKASSEDRCDIVRAMDSELAGGNASTAQPAVMPADVWARLAAAVQLEAARLNSKGGLNPDSVLLRPDPLLAPRKSRPRESGDRFDLSSPSRLLMLLGLALLVGVVLTIYIMTRPAAPSAGPGDTPTPDVTPPPGEIKP